MKRLLDSVILIDHFNGIAAATSHLEAVHQDAYLSLITRSEVLTGFSEEDTRSRALPVLNYLPLLPLAKGDADHAAKLRRQFRWKLPDAFQAALALRYDLRLATRNTKDFDPEQHAFVEVPYRL